MSNAFGSLNLSTQERRIVVVTGTILFVLLNFWLVWPRFKDWNRVRTAITEAETTLYSYKAELGRTNDYQLKLTNLVTAGSQVLPSDQSVHLVSTVQAQATRSKLAHAGIRPMGRAGGNVNTNRFFEEQTVEVGLNPTDDNNLVDFLVAIGSGESMIRVKELQLRPDNTQMKLQGKMQLVASFQKKAPEVAAEAQTTNTSRTIGRPRPEPAGAATNTSRPQRIANKP